MQKINFYFHKMSAQSISSLAGAYPAVIVVTDGGEAVWRSWDKFMSRIDTIPEMARKIDVVRSIYDNLTKTADISVLALSDRSVRENTILSQLETVRGQQIA